MRVVPYLMVLTLVASVPAASAQEVTWGIKGGVNFATQHTDEEIEQDALKNRVGIVAGVFFSVPVGGLFSVQPEVLYSQKGSKFELEGLAEGTIEVDYVEIPILLRVGQWNASATTFHAFVGPSLGFKVRAKAKGESGGESETVDISDEIETFDFGLVFGGGVDFGRFTVDGRYTWGLSNINVLIDDEPDDAKVTNRVFSIMAGVRF
jgi:outer membrane immunogenic protein